MVSVGDIVRARASGVMDHKIWFLVVKCEEHSAMGAALEDHSSMTNTKYPIGKTWWFSYSAASAGEPPDHIIAMAMRLALTEGVGV